MRYCPLCKKNRDSFKAYGSPRNRRKDAECGNCGSLERNRLLWLFLAERTNLINDISSQWIMHFSPRSCWKNVLSSYHNWIAADLNAIGACKIDITNIKYDAIWDVILCSHVLEHIKDDKKAISEMYRVLRTGGYAVIQVPTEGDETKEDFTLNAEERTKQYGAGNHVRMYGVAGLKERLEEAGFLVEVFTPDRLASAKVLEVRGITNEYTGVIFYCKKEYGDV